MAHLIELPMPPGERYVPPHPAAVHPVLSSRSRPGRVIACAGARGGAGASVLSAALARCAVRSGLDCLLIDGDPLGSGLDLLLGAEDAPGMRWPDLALARGELVPGTLGQSLPLIDGVRVLTWDRGASAVRVLGEALPAVLAAGRAEHDLVVLDLARSGPGLAGAASLVSLGLLLVPLEVRAASAAAKSAAQVFGDVGDVRLVTRGPAPTGLSTSAVASVLRLPVAAHLRAETGLAAALDRGEPPALRPRGPLARACRAILGQLAVHGSAGGFSGGAARSCAERGSEPS